MLKLKVKPVGTAIGALAGAAIGYALAHQAGAGVQDAPTLVRLLPYVSGIPCFTVLCGATGYATDKIREIKKYGEPRSRDSEDEEPHLFI